MYNKTIVELSADLRAKKYSSEELTRALLARIDKFNPQLNALITLTGEHALSTARSADARLASGTAGPLTGIPIVQKDIFCTQGVKTTCGSKMLDNFIAPYDATTVIKLKEAGTVMLGKANMDEFAMGSSNETSYYGPVRNPWDLNAVPGGSSGGSAAVVAARLAPAATGTDTGGSIRQPAALCGITGIKPTYGSCSRYGMIAYASSLDQAGPMAHSARDCALVLNAMVGFDAKDSTSVQRPVSNEDFTAGFGKPLRGGDTSKPLAGMRVGLPAEFFGEGLAG